MSLNVKADVLGELIDILKPLSSRQKVELTLIVLAAMSASFAAGYWLKTNNYENKLAAAEARHEQEKLALNRRIEQDAAVLQRELQELQTKVDQGTPAITRIGLYYPGEENTPKLADAATSNLSLAEFATLRPKDSAAYLERTGQLTALQKPKYDDKYSNKSFTWAGFVSDVGMQGSSENPEYLVKLRLDLQKADSFAVSCVFAGRAYEEMMKALIKNQKVTVRGVLAESGRLLDCRLVRSDPPPQSSDPR